MTAMTPFDAFRSDPRHYQIAVLSLLLAWGALGLDFGISPLRVALLIGTALATQLALSRSRRLAFEPRSALISSLSLALLLRTGSELVAVAAAFVAIASKFWLRYRGKHLWNPTNLAILLAVASGRGWVSPGQWGNAALFGFLVACLGGVVVHRSLRSDVAVAFLATHLAIVFGRAAWLGQPLAIPLHQISSGALLIFAFFMISDPKTTPDARTGRLVFGALVALGAGAVTFLLYRPNGLLIALVAAAPLVPLLDRLLPGDRFEWRRPERVGAAFALPSHPVSAPRPAGSGVGS